MSIITLTSDSGLKDPSIAAVKGSLYSMIDQPIIVDISHDITLYSVMETAYIIKAAYPKFPKGSIHIIGVDSENSTNQRHIIAKLNGHYFIAADNGIFSLLAEKEEYDILIDIHHPKSTHSSFPMLDVFVDIAAQITYNEKLESLGNSTSEIKKWVRSKPNLNLENELIGHISYIDRYGNLVTDVSKKCFTKFAEGRRFEIIASNAKINKIQRNYSSFIDYKLPVSQRQRAGKAIAIFNSIGFLEIALYKSNPSYGGSASTLLGLGIGDSIKIVFEY